MQKLVTIYLPTHNRIALLKRAIKSVLNQTYKNVELIVCDDGSTDGTWEYLNNLTSQDSRLKIIRNINPLGACISRNRCIDSATGHFITGLDDDDFFHPYRIEFLLNLIKTKHTRLVSSNYFYIDKENEIIGEVLKEKIRFKEMGYRNLVGNQIFCYTDDMKNIGGFDVHAPAWQDYDLWYRMIKNYGDCFRTNKPLYYMDLSHDAPRITTSSKAFNGYKFFLEKHKNSLSFFQRNSLFLEDKVNRGDTISFKDVYSHFCFHGVISFFKKIIKEKCPTLKKILLLIKSKII